MQSELREHKEAIRRFLRADYPDEQLAWLLAHARSGKLVYQSCCCLIGVRTAQHALQGKNNLWMGYEGHAYPHTLLSGAAGSAYCNLAHWTSAENPDESRRRILIPIIRAEQRRRDRLRQTEQVPSMNETNDELVPAG